MEEGERGTNELFVSLAALYTSTHNKAKDYHTISMHM